MYWQKRLNNIMLEAAREYGVGGIEIFPIFPPNLGRTEWGQRVTAPWLGARTTLALQKEGTSYSSMLVTVLRTDVDPAARVLVSAIRSLARHQYQPSSVGPSC